MLDEKLYVLQDCINIAKKEAKLWVDITPDAFNSNSKITNFCRLSLWLFWHAEISTFGLALRPWILVHLTPLPSISSVLSRKDRDVSQRASSLDLWEPSTWPDILYQGMAPQRVWVSTRWESCEGLEVEEDELHYWLAEKEPTLYISCGRSRFRLNLAPNACGDLC